MRKHFLVGRCWFEVLQVLLKLSDHVEYPQTNFLPSSALLLLLHIFSASGACQCSVVCGTHFQPVNSLVFQVWMKNMQPACCITCLLLQECWLCPHKPVASHLSKSCLGMLIGCEEHLFYECHFHLALSCNTPCQSSVTLRHARNRTDKLNFGRSHINRMSSISIAAEGEISWLSILTDFKPHREREREILVHTEVALLYSWTNGSFVNWSWRGSSVESDTFKPLIY